MIITNHKNVVLFALAGVVLLAGGFAAGRYATPARVEFKDKAVEVASTHTVESVDTATILNAIATLRTQLEVQKNVHTKKVVEQKPDGTKTTTIESEDTSTSKATSDATKQTQEKTATQDVKTQDKLVYKEHETTKTVVNQLRPDWSFSLQMGYDFAGALGHGQPINLIPQSVLPIQHVVAGVSIEHRLFGPISTGIWANTQGAGGLVLRLDL